MTVPGQNTWEASDYPVDAPVDANNDAFTSVTGRKAETDDAPVLQVVPNEPISPRRGLGIGFKATVLAAVFGVLPVLVVGNVAYRSANQSITERIAQEEISGVDQLSDQLRRFLQERVANASTVANITQESGLFASDLEPREKAAITARLTRELTQFVQDYRTYSSLGIFSVNGDVLVQSTGSAQEVNQQGAAYFQQVLSTQAPVISEPVAVETAMADVAAIYVAVPVKDAAGTVLGVVVAKIPVEFVGNAILRAASLGQDTQYRLVDSSGEIFQSLPADPENPQVGLPVADLLSRFSDVNDQKQRQAWIETVQDQEFLNAYAPLQGFDALNWSVVTSINTDLAFLPQRQLLQTILVGTLLTGVTAVLLGIVLARRATRPVSQAAKAVELLGQGQLDARVPVRGNDELAILGMNVNRMGAQIQDLLATLRQNAEQLGLQNDVLADLARHEALIQGDAQAAATSFSEAIARTLGLDVVSVWLTQPEQTRLLCLSRYQQGSRKADVVTALSIDEVPDYFAAIAQNQILSVTHVADHPASRELQAENALAPTTVSLLEVPIQITGTVVGSLRCEHSGNPRDWRAEEQTFIGSVANLISLALESEVLQGEVSHLLDVVSEVEDGNLTVQARVSDRTTGLVADTFNRLIERLADVLKQVTDTAQQVTVSANQQKTQASLISANADKQVTGVNQILTLTAQVQTLAEATAHQVETTSASLQAVQTTVAAGQQAITNLTSGIGILQEGSDRIIQQMKTLGEFVGLADQFVQDQTQVASLTQTLALNASLVAARAAEQRDPRQFVVAAREFSSIANQVSQLAQQTNNSLTTLEQRSAQIQSVVFAVDADVQRLGGLVDEFTHGVSQSRQVFSDVQTVTVAAVEAETAVTQVSQNIVEAVQEAAAVVRTITDIATQTAGLTQDNRLQSEQMETLSYQLLETIQFFQLPTAPHGAAPNALAASPSAASTAAGAADRPL
ncbi:cache domain-containing protein [Pseudanabaena sp. FACHB-2040]|uniref:methyl-accepting chemotaxis protein n=1 Tax=Pseudanabaena sp. FACHB-2040 TaxID=2692859 RepID=UPI0016878851|nr:cache domain-containing protein [Pseudanabaena sp. FACHB-2040]MBD2258362.1 GAF domain-containing protein [Pseudanabaena sp. FACHB-2040]